MDIKENPAQKPERVEPLRQPVKDPRPTPTPQPIREPEPSKVPA